MMLEPQTEMTVEGEEEDDEDDGGSTGDDIALPPSVTLRPAGGPPTLAVRSNILYGSTGPCEGRYSVLPSSCRGRQDWSCRRRCRSRGTRGSA